MQNIIEETLARWNDISDQFWKVRNTFSTIIRWIFITIVPMLLGWYFDKFIQEKLTLDSIFQKLFSEHYWPIPALTALFIIGTIWSIDSQTRRTRIDLLSFCLHWLYSDLEFDAVPENDVRCTVWAPIKSKVRPENMKIVQLVDYFPRFENRGNATKYYRMNQNRGRIKKVARRRKNSVIPIGIVGLCIVDSLRDHKAYILEDSLEDIKDFQAYHMESYNYNHAEARRLTQDRRSYMAVPVMDAAKTDILGVVYFDSRKPNIFSKDVEAKVNDYLPMVAEALASSDRS